MWNSNLFLSCKERQCAWRERSCKESFVREMENENENEKQRADESSCGKRKGGKPK